MSLFNMSASQEDVSMEGEEAGRYQSEDVELLEEGALGAGGSGPKANSTSQFPRGRRPLPCRPPGLLQVSRRVVGGVDLGNVRAEGPDGGGSLSHLVLAAAMPF